MVVNNAYSLFSFLEQFDPDDRDHLKTLEQILNLHPNFQWVRAYYLKAIQHQDPERFDKTLSHTAIATYDRELLYEFIEHPQKKDLLKVAVEKEQHAEENKTLKKKSSDDKTGEKVLEPQTPPETLRFSEWASYLKTRRLKEPEEELNKNLSLLMLFSPNKEELYLTKQLIVTKTLVKKAGLQQMN